jgi:LuxR family maltose regulon positive regulatory protein
MHVWLDFEWWSCLQLYARGLDGKEYIQKAELASLLHKKREAELEAFQANLELYIIQNKALQSLARFDDAYTQARALVEFYESLPKTRIHCWLLSECYFNLGFIGIYTALHTNARDHSHFFERGWHYFQLSDRLVKGPRERALVSSYVCRVAYPAQKGDLERANEIFSSYVSYSIEAKNGMMQGIVELAFCEAAYFKGDLKKAEGLAHQAFNKARQAEQFQVENRALFILIRINIHRGNPEKIRVLLQQLEAQLTNEEFLYGYTLYDIVQGWFLAQIRQVDRVASWLRSDFEKSDLNSLLYGLENLVRAKCFLVDKNYQGVLAALTGQDTKYGLEAFLLGKLEVMALRAVCQYQVGDKKSALQTLREAYGIARGEDLDMPFIELGKDMRTLAGAAMKEKGCGIPAAWLEKVYRKSSAYAKNLNYIIADYRNYNQLNDHLFSLTKREKEVLSDLCRGLSRAEIAYNRNVSDSNVKMMIQMIYTKLGAENTANAIWIAATSKLLQ